MSGFYEQKQDNKKCIICAFGPKFTFPSHFHQKIEIFLLIEGSLDVSLNGMHYSLRSGDIMFFDSYDVHSYSKHDLDVKGLAIIIPLSSAKNFLSRKDGKKVIFPCISNAELCNKLYSIAIDYIATNDHDNTVKNSAIELFLSILEEKLPYGKNNFSDETTLMQNILLYISENFRSDLTLSLIAKKFGYSKEHVSRVFHRYMNVGLPEYINNLRLDYIQNNSQGKKITKLLFDAGFNSIQSYYRAKSKRKSS